MGISYQRLNTTFSFGLSTKWRKQLVQQISATDNVIEIIDLMSGTGEMWEIIFDKFPNAQLTALDFSEEMTKCALDKNKSQFQNSVNVLRQDFLNNTLPSNHYDIAICAFGLKTFSQAQLHQFMTEVKRILKPKGTLFCVELTLPKNVFLKSFYYVYLKIILPFIGSLFIQKHNGHKLLWQYIHAFQKENKLHTIQTSDEMLKITCKPLCFGYATVVHGKLKSVVEI